MTGADRREQITAEITERTGITEAMIERLVRGFYARVRQDAVLAPVFEAAAREICPPEAAAHFVERARRIAASLELGIAGGQGVLLAPGERFRRNETGAVQ